MDGCLEREDGNCHRVPPSPCPYFARRTGKIASPDQYEPLRVPVCRCFLAETLVSRLGAHPDGAPIASSMQGHSFAGQLHSIIGSDFQPVSALACTDARKSETCLPAFLGILSDLSLDPSVPSVLEAATLHAFVSLVPPGEVR